jgi:hypothetical protein
MVFALAGDSTMSKFFAITNVQSNTNRLPGRCKCLAV